MYRFLLSYLVAMLLCVNVFAAATNPVNGLSVFYQRQTPNGTIYIASQPDQASFATIKALNVKTILNLRTKSEMKFDEAEIVQKTGMVYINLPISHKSLDVKSVEQFSKILSNKNNYPIFIHCHSANRSAMMLALNEILVNKYSANEAINDAKQYGLNEPSLETKIRQLAPKLKQMKDKSK